MKTRRTEIYIETERTVVVSTPRKMVAWCAGCGSEVEMVSVDETAILARVSSRTIYQWLEAGKLHSAETPEGLLLVCINSLTKGETIKPETTTSQDLL